jgi:V-type H+-transporting ATPase subunit F
VAETIRHMIDDYDAMMPTVLEIPSKENAYDPGKDSIMVRIMKKMQVSD